jgi:low temperature requirement protein LtrA
MTNRFVAGFSLSILLFAVSVFVPPPWRFWLWSTGLLIDLVTPMFTLQVQTRLPRLSTSKLPERFGLFMIIVLGEAIVGVVSGVAEQEQRSWRTAFTGTLGMVLAFGLWWVYFDFVARRRARPSIWWPLGWNYLHMPLAMAIAALGAAVLNVIAADSSTLAPNLRWLLCGAIAVALIVIGLLEAVLRRDPDEPTELRTSAGLKFVAGLLALMPGAWGSRLGSLMLLGVLLVPLLILMGYGTYVWFQPRSVEA